MTKHLRLAVWACICIFFLPSTMLASDMDTENTTDTIGNPYVPNVSFYPEDGYDWLQLTSGEWLKGEFLGMVDGTVEFDSVILDELSIDTEDVMGFRSNSRYGLTVRGEEPITGNLTIRNGQVIVDTEDGQRLVDPDSLVAVAVKAVRERDRWSGRANLGGSLRQGNSDRVEYTAIATLVRRTAESRVIIDYIGSYDRTDDIETTNDHRLNIVADRFSSTRLFWRPINGQYLRDPLQNIDHQFTLETGLGYELIDNARTEWDVYAGVGANRLRSFSVEEGMSRTSTAPSYSLGTQFDTELTDNTDFEFSFQMTFLEEDAGDYQHHLVTGISTELFGDLDLDLSFIWDRIGSPLPEADGSIPEQDDFRVITSIGFDF